MQGTENKSNINESELKWESLDGSEFEEFCYYLIQEIGFTNVELVAGHGDRGKDLRAEFRLDIPSLYSETQKWIFQCKRCLNISKKMINDEIVKVRWADVSTWVLVTTAKQTPSLIDWIDDLNKSKEYRFRVFVWWRNDVDLKTYRYLGHLKDKLPSNLQTKIGLNSIDRSFDINEFHSILAKCRTYNTNQIQIHARKKYIREIYVNREIEKDLKLFHSAEGNQSSVLYSILKKKLNESIELLKDLNNTILKNETIELTKTDLEILKNNNLPKNENFKKIYVKEDAKNRFIKLIEEIIIILIECKDGLSENKIFCKIDNYNHMIEVINKARENTSSLEDKLIEEFFIDELEEEIRKIAARKILNYYSIDSINFKLNECTETIKTYINHVFVLIDRAGGGKTNLLCDLAITLSKEEPCILIFGKSTLQSPKDLINNIAYILGCSQNENPREFLVTHNQILENSNSILHILIDGINENNSIQLMNIAIAELVKFTEKFRVRITISCRDIYWEFFESEMWEHNIAYTKRNVLYNFSENEYNYALPLYLRHFHIKGMLVDEAYHACQHPLLLRFFCEAYGDIDGKEIDIGSHHEIRLKELFDVYFSKKTEAIRLKFHLRTKEQIENYLFSLVSEIFNRSISGQNSAILKSSLSELTHENNLDTADSLYISFLDEDIIIEEAPTKDFTDRIISFVYEEFMEYVFANFILRKHFQIDKLIPNELFEFLDKSLAKWINTRGTAEYICIILLSSKDAIIHKKGVELLNLMAKGNEHWKAAFWSTMGKIDLSSLSNELLSASATAVSYLDQELHVIEAFAITWSSQQTRLN